MEYATIAKNGKVLPLEKHIICEKTLRRVNAAGGLPNNIKIDRNMKRFGVLYEKTIVLNTVSMLTH